MKKLVIASAVAALASVSVAQAGSTLTGSFRYGLNYSDGGDGADADIAIKNHGSRIKWKGDSPVGSNTGYANFEARLNSGVDFDTKDDDPKDRLGLATRTYAVGLKGDFGDLSFGTQDSAFDVAGNRDGTWWNGANEGYVGNTSEKEGVLKYSRGFGDLKLAFGAQMLSGDADADAIDLADVSLLYSADAITAGVAVQSNVGGAAGSDGTAIALTGGYDFGSGNVNLTYGIEDEDFAGKGKERTGINLQAFFGDFFGWYGQSELDGSGETPTTVGVGYTQKLSDQATVWYELVSDDDDDGTDADTGAHAVLKYDF